MLDNNLTKLIALPAEKILRIFSAVSSNPISLRSWDIALPGFEPGSFGPEPKMLDHYTKGLYKK